MDILNEGRHLNRKALCTKLLSRSDRARAPEESHYQTLIGLLFAGRITSSIVACCSAAVADEGDRFHKPAADLNAVRLFRKRVACIETVMNNSETEEITDEIIGEAVLALLKTNRPITTTLLTSVNAGDRTRSPA